jgi:hypothetical protein
LGNVPDHAMSQTSMELSYRDIHNMTLRAQFDTPQQRSVTMARIPIPALESTTDATAEIYAQIREALREVQNTFAAIGAHGRATLEAIRKTASSAAIRRMIVPFLLATASTLLVACADTGGVACADASGAACAHSKGEFSFGGNPLWQPPAHISDTRPN